MNRRKKSRYKNLRFSNRADATGGIDPSATSLRFFAVTHPSEAEQSVAVELSASDLGLYLVTRLRIDPGEMGTSMFWAGRNELFEQTLGKLEGWLAAEGYVGSIDLNCIVNDTGIYPLEFTPRFGYPTIALQEEGIESSTTEFFYDLARGAAPEPKVHRGYQVGVRLVLLPFPFDDEQTYDESSRNAVIVFESDDRNGIHLEDTKRIDGQWRAAGENGMPLVVTGTGETMQEARTQCYTRIERITIPNLYYRDDIGERWIAGDGDRLQAWGYLGPKSQFQ